MNVEQNNVSETNADLRIKGYASVFIQFVSLCTKILKLATRSTCIDARYISNKLSKPEIVYIFTIFSDREGISQSNEGQVYFDCNKPGVVWCIQDPKLIPLFLNLLTDINQNQYPLCWNHTLTLAAEKVSIIL